MTRTAINVDGFDKLFAVDPDSWDYRNSRFESFKRSKLLSFCGDKIYGRGLELGCANGETTFYLSQKCLRLTASDGSANAVQFAKERVAKLSNVTVLHAFLPSEMPRGRFDLIVISELLYYLTFQQLKKLTKLCGRSLSPTGRIVFLYHTKTFSDVSQLPSTVHKKSVTVLGRSFRKVRKFRSSKYEVVALQRGK